MKRSILAEWLREVADGIEHGECTAGVVQWSTVDIPAGSLLVTATVHFKTGETTRIAPVLPIEGQG